MWNMKKKNKTTINAYWQDQILRNNTFYYVVCIAIIVLELYMILTYFVSQSAAFPTLPEKYLRFYLSAGAGSALYAGLFYICRDRKSPLAVLHLSYLVLLLFWAVWLSQFDIKNGNNAYVFLQVLIFTAAGIRLPNWLHLSLNTLITLIFMLGLCFLPIGSQQLYNEMINTGIFLVLSGIIVVYGNHLHYGYISMYQTVQRQNQRLSYYAERDSLTGVLNRRMIMNHLYQGVRKGVLGCCVILDLDDFKQYNDTFGHPEGDALLKGLAALITDFLRIYGAEAGRYGGEEFLLLFPKKAGLDVAAVMDKLLADIRRHSFRRTITASAGGCICRAGMSEEDVLSLALFPQVAEKFIKLRNTRHPLGQRFIKPLEHAEKVERHIAPLSRKK